MPEFNYELIVRQHPNRCRVLSLGEKVDRRPIEPVPIVQLKLKDSQGEDDPSVLFGTNYFMVVSMEGLNLETERTVRAKSGNSNYSIFSGPRVSSLYCLRDLDETEGAFFVFPNLSVRMEGTYCLKFELYCTNEGGSYLCATAKSQSFTCFSFQRFPGSEASTQLSLLFIDQGVKIPYRKRFRGSNPPKHLTIKKFGVEAAEPVLPVPKLMSPEEQRKTRRRRKRSPDSSRSNSSPPSPFSPSVSPPPPTSRAIKKPKSSNNNQKPSKLEHQQQSQQVVTIVTRSGRKTKMVYHDCDDFGSEDEDEEQNDDDNEEEEEEGRYEEEEYERDYNEWESEESEEYVEESGSVLARNQGFQNEIVEIEMPMEQISGRKFNPSYQRQETLLVEKDRKVQQMTEAIEVPPFPPKKQGKKRTGTESKLVTSKMDNGSKAVTAKRRKVQEKSAEEAEEMHDQHMESKILLSLSERVPYPHPLPPSSTSTVLKRNQPHHIPNVHPYPHSSFTIMPQPPCYQIFTPSPPSSCASSPSSSSTISSPALIPSSFPFNHLPSSFSNLFSSPTSFPFMGKDGSLQMQMQMKKVLPSFTDLVNSLPRFEQQQA